MEGALSVATELFANQPSTIVTSGGTGAPASGTQETWTVASSSPFPAASSSASPPAQFHACDTAFGKTSEIVTVTNVSGTTWTVIRGAEGTTPIAHSAGFTVQQAVTAGYLGGTGPVNTGTLNGYGYQVLGGGHSAKLQGWFGSLADRQFACTSIAVIGTSITMGEGASAFSNTWCQRLAALLRTRFGVSGGGRGWLNPEPHELTTWVPPYVTVSGSPASHNGFSPELLAWDFTTAGQQWVYSLNGDSADIMWVGNTGDGTFSYQVDSGSVTDVSTSVTFSDGQITHVSLGAAGSHTLTISYVSGNPVYLDGVREYNGDYTAGIQVSQCGFGGAITSDWAGTTSDPFATPAAVAALNPGLVIIELGVNDNANGISPSQTQANLATLIAGLRSAPVYANPPYPPPYLLLADYNAYGNSGMSNALWAEYVDAMYAVAAGDPEVDVLDLSLRMPSTAAVNTWGLYAGDKLHPSNNGHQMIADAVCDFLCPA